MNKLIASGVVVLLCLIGANQAAAYDFSAACPSGQTLYYSFASDSEVKAVAPSDGDWASYTKPTGHLVIPATVAYGGTTYSVTSIGMRAFANCSGLTRITLSEGLLNIDAMAFFNCTQLDTISLPTTLKRIAVSVFDGSAYYTNASHWTASSTLIIDSWLIKQSSYTEGGITVPEGVKGLANSAFFYCKQLSYVDLPKSLLYVGEGCFMGCNSIDTLRTRATTPPAAYDDSFASFTSVLAVPYGKAAAYQAANYWKNFTHIAEDPQQADDSVDNPILPPLPPLPPIPPVVGIDEADAHGGWTLTCMDGAICVDGAEGLAVQVYNAVGKLLYSTVSAASSMRFELPGAGIYVVRVGESVRKVVCRR